MKKSKFAAVAASVFMLAASALLTGCYFNGADYTFHFGKPGGEAHNHVDTDGNGKCDVCDNDMPTGGGSDEEFSYKTPTKAFAEWQEYTNIQYAKEDVSTKTIAYQFVKEDVDLSGREYDILVNLYDDGFAQIRQYKTDENYATIYYGYWANMEDSIYMATVCHLNTSMGGTVYGISYSYNLTYENGAFADFGLNVALGFAEGGQFVRNLMVGGSGAVVYQTVKDFEQHIGVSITVPAPSEKPEEPEEPTDPTVKTMKELTTKLNLGVEVTFTLTMKSDGSFVITNSMGNEAFNVTGDWELKTSPTPKVEFTNVSSGEFAYALGQSGVTMTWTGTLGQAGEKTLTFTMPSSELKDLQ
ncbi:MAG: hypothetical protein OSJ83_06895 [Clostridia bacterium]|nr:hypothetical protein [Clostridia bacterium]